MVVAPQLWWFCGFYSLCPASKGSLPLSLLVSSGCRCPSLTSTSEALFCRLGMHHLCDFGDGVARPICGVVCPIQERSLNQVEARANPRYSASSTSTSRSLFGRSSEGLNPDSNPRLLVAAGVHLWLAARVQDGHVCNQTGCRASPEGVSLHVASHLGRLGHIL